MNQVSIILDDSSENFLLPLLQNKLNEKLKIFTENFSSNYKTTHKVVIIGDYRVGKTRITHRLQYNKFLKPDTHYDDPMPMALKTIYYNHDYVSGLLFDTSNQELHSSFDMPINFYRGAKGVIVCYDITNRTSFGNVEKWIENAQKKLQTGYEMILVGTKADLERNVSTLEGLQLANMYGMKIFYETSSKNGQNIEEMFSNLLKLLSKFEEPTTEVGEKMNQAESQQWSCTLF